MHTFCGTKKIQIQDHTSLVKENEIHSYQFWENSWFIEAENGEISATKSQNHPLRKWKCRIFSWYTLIRPETIYKIIQEMISRGGNGEKKEENNETAKDA